MRPSVLWEIWQNKTSKKYFQRRFHEPTFLHLLMPRKELKSLRHICSSWLAARLCRNVCLTAHPLQQITYTLNSTTHTSSVKFFRANWEAVSQAVVLTLPETKLNTQLSHCVFFYLTASYKTHTALTRIQSTLHILTYSVCYYPNLNMENMRHRQSK